MQLFKLKTRLSKFDHFADFAREFKLSEHDLVITNEFLYEPFMKSLNLPCHFIMQEKFGLGEPSDKMMNTILKEVKGVGFDRVIAVGGGTVIDISKLFVLKGVEDVTEAFERKIPIVKEKQLVILPTTCGTGSEVTNISIAEIDVFQGIAANGPEYRFERLGDMLMASNYAGIAFGNTGVGAVHALSYPLGGSYHVPHGESNYQFFTEVFKLYNAKNPSGDIARLNDLLCVQLGVNENPYPVLDELLGKLIPKNKLRVYGMKPEEIQGFTSSVLQTQQRLLANNYVSLSEEEIREIYKVLY